MAKRYCEVSSTAAVRHNTVVQSTAWLRKQHLTALYIAAVPLLLLLTPADTELSSNSNTSTQQAQTVPRLSRIHTVKVSVQRLFRQGLFLRYNWWRQQLLTELFPVYAVKEPVVCHHSSSSRTVAVLGVSVQGSSCQQ
jgi:hypothetical protein